MALPAFALSPSLLCSPEPCPFQSTANLDRLPAFNSFTYNTPRRPRSSPRCSLYPLPSDPPTGPSPIFQPGELLNERYRTRTPLGGGGQAVTWSAVDERAQLIEDEDVVLKVLSLRGMGAWKALEMLTREARVLQSLKHEGVPQYVDYFETDRRGDRVFVLVQRRAHGKCLMEWVESGWRFGRGGVEAVLRGILEVLDYLHGLSPPVVHRDVKPENVVVGIEDSVVTKVSLVDFGGVSGVKLGQTWGNVGSTVVGTFGYMAPEQARGVVDSRSDLYGAGATILFMLTGRMPGELPHNKLRIDLEKVFGAEDRRRLGRLYQVLRRLLEPALEDRVASAHLVLDLLDGEANFPTDVDPAGTEVLEVIQDVRGGLFNWATVSRRVIRKPPDSKVIVRKEHDGQLLRVEIPRPGLNVDAISTGIFALVWYGFLGFWVVGALTGGRSLVTSLFSLPFWIGGAQIVRRSADEYGSRAMLVVEKPGNQRNDGISHFQLTIDSPLRKPQKITGDARDLVDVSVECVSTVQGKPHYALQLREDSRIHQFGEFLKYDEQQYIACAIKEFLGRNKRLF